MEILKSKLLEQFVSIKHAFFTRNGGISSGAYSSLNCSYESNDLRHNVIENRRRALAHFNKPLTSLVTLHDIHSTKTLVVEKPWTADQSPRADGMVTNKPEIVLGAVSADCPVILFVDYQSRVIGTAHAGWRSAKNGIIQSVISAMLSLNANTKNIHAAVGPCIAQCSYEVDINFYKNFIIESDLNQHYFKSTNNENYFLFDLRSYICSKLKFAGIEHIDSIGGDTYQENDKFFSYRRSCHHNEKDYGCHFACIFLEN